MVDQPRRPAAALRRALGVLLLALAAVLGLTVTDGAAGPAPDVVVTVDAGMVDGPVAGMVDGPADAGRGHGHHDDGALALLCLCALLVASGLLTAHRRPLRRPAPRTVDEAGVSWPAGVVLPAGTDPRDWGVHRT